MIHILNDEKEFQISKHFFSSEFICQCRECHISMIEESLIDRLEILRRLIDQPIIIASGYRCQEHNREIGGANYSRHCCGQAVDIKVQERGSLEEFASDVFPYSYTGENFIHCDIR